MTHSLTHLLDTHLTFARRRELTFRRFCIPTVTCWTDCSIAKRLALFSISSCMGVSGGNALFTSDGLGCIPPAPGPATSSPAEPSSTGWSSISPFCPTMSGREMLCFSKQQQQQQHANSKPNASSPAAIHREAVSQLAKQT